MAITMMMSRTAPQNTIDDRFFKIGDYFALFLFTEIAGLLASGFVNLLKPPNPFAKAFCRAEEQSCPPVHKRCELGQHGKPRRAIVGASTHMANIDIALLKAPPPIPVVKALPPISVVANAPALPRMSGNGWCRAK